MSRIDKISRGCRLIPLALLFLAGHVLCTHASAGTKPSFQPPAVTHEVQYLGDFEPENLTAPSFRGGEISGFRSWVVGRLKYPPEAYENGIEGVVIASFIVDKKGRVGNIEIIQSPHPSMSKEVRRVLRKSPKWMPGSVDNEPVGVKYTLPVNFSLPRQ